MQFKDEAGRNAALKMNRTQMGTETIRVTPSRFSLIPVADVSVASTSASTGASGSASTGMSASAANVTRVSGSSGAAVRDGAAGRAGASVGAGAGAGGVDGRADVSSAATESHIDYGKVKQTAAALAK